MFIDTHTHLYTTEFDTDRLDAVKRAKVAGARALLLPNIDENSITPMLQLCKTHPGLCYPMMGLHPTELPPNPNPLLERMERMLAAPEAPFVAVGEVGIDLYWDSSRRTEQIKALQQQAEWAVRYQLPLMVHTRQAHHETIETLRPLANKLTGVFHCFGGTTEEAKELIETFPGFMLGIGGIVTFKKSHLPATLHAAIPLERIVVETDAPYLAPTPHRGKRNEPAYIPHIIEKLAEIYTLPLANIEAQLLKNTLLTFPRLKQLQP